MKVKHFIALLIAMAIFLTACSPSLLTIDGQEASFHGHMVKLYGQYAPLTDFHPEENYLKLYNDGTGVIAFSSSEDSVTWRLEDGTYYIAVEGTDCPATYSDGLLTMDLDGGIITYVAEGVQAPEIPTTEAPDYDTDLTSPYGTYHGLTINEFGSVSDMAVFYGADCYIRLDSDGMGILCLGGSEQQFAWELNGTEFTIADMNGINSTGYLEKGILVLDYMNSGIQLAFAKEGADS